jgi:hypothetical protein
LPCYHWQYVGISDILNFSATIKESLQVAFSGYLATTEESSVVQLVQKMHKFNSML